MSLTDEEREAEVTQALADAGVSRHRVRFYAVESLGADDNVGAVWYRPGMEVEAGDRHLPGAAVRAELNDSAGIDHHRIVLPAHPDDRITFAGLLRHELEHARQYDALGQDVFDLQHFLECDVLPEVAGGLDGCAGGLINAIPTEIDCNAAASVYITGRFPAEDVQRLRAGPRRVLACSLLGPAPHETLIPRMVAFAFVYRAGVEALARRHGFSVGGLLRSVHSEAPAIWDKLEAHV